jgi:predicted transcriptional regulator of viral defense system
MKKRREHSAKFREAKRIFIRGGGTMRTMQAIEAGIHPRTLYAMRDRKIIEEISRGLFRLAELPPDSAPDYTALSLRAPRAVICLASALAFHGLMDKAPKKICIAIQRGERVPRFDDLPVAVYVFSKDAFEAGIEEFNVDGFTVRVYSPEKTLADCFKFRNKIGMETVLDALKNCRATMKFKVSEILKYARVCRVERIMRPYLEAIL